MKTTQVQSSIANSPLVSVIIPLYNAEKYIAQTIENVLQQTYKKIELIIIDDGSSDDSLLVAKKYESNQVKIYTQLNSGASAARNYGLREANGDYIQFLDADDLLSLNKIEEQVKDLVNNPGYLSVCSSVHFFDGEDPFNKEIPPTWFGENLNDPLTILISMFGGYDGQGKMITIHSWLSPINLIKSAGFWNEQLTVDDDGEFFCRVILKSKKIIFSANCANYYRKFISNKSLSGSLNYVGVNSSLESCFLKSKYLISATNDKFALVAISRMFHEIAVYSYPKFKNLSAIAEKESKKIYNYKNTSYYHTTFYRFITPIFGWKASAYLAFYKSRIINFVKGE